MKNTTSIQRQHMFLFKKGMLTVPISLFCFFTMACADKEPIDEDDVDPSINPPITFVEDEEDAAKKENEAQFPDFGYSADPIAFPGAEGYGRRATGARGSSQREIYKVTNLNTSGSGSLKDAISKENRIIVFAVAGVLDMKKETYVLHNNQTLLFETAPGDGFTMFNGRISGSAAENVIVRYMRVRQGKDFGENKGDCAGLASHGNQIYDHCSLTWGGDETFSVNWDKKNTSRPYNVTLQNSIIGQGLQNHSAGGLMQTRLNEGTTIFRNLFIDNKTRNLKVKGLNQYVNNVVYNWGNGSCYDMGGDSEGDSNTTIVNNYFIKGPGNNWMNIAHPKDFDYETYCAEDPDHRHFSTISSSNEVLIEEFVPVNPSKPISGAKGTGVVSTYCIGNYYDYDTNGSINGVEITQRNWDEYCSGTPVFLETPDAIHPIIQNQTSAEEAYKYIVEKVGASLPKRDAVDAYLIEELTSLGKLGTILRDQGQEYQYPLANTWQNMDTTNNIIDTDGDGLPDDFEDKWGLNKKNKYDAIRTANNGYLNIENYAFSLEYPELYEKAYQKWINH